jgi:hypothetical protein
MATSPIVNPDTTGQPATPTSQIDSGQTAPPNNANPSQVTDRAAIAAKYQELYGGTPTSTEDQPDNQAAANADPAAPPAGDVVVTSATPPTEDRLASVEASLGRMTELLSKLTEPPKAPELPGSTDPVETQWLNLIREGKIKEAFDLQANEAARRASSQARSEAVESMRVEREISDFVADLRSKNAELLPLEELIASKAAAKIQVAHDSGKIKNTSDYVKFYKTSVNEATEDARKIVQSIRAAGKQAGLTIKTEVLSSTPMTPNSPNVDRTSTPQNPPLESAMDYITKRKTAAEKMHGMFVPAT